MNTTTTEPGGPLRGPVPCAVPACDREVTQTTTGEGQVEWVHLNKHGRPGERVRFTMGYGNQVYAHHARPHDAVWVGT